jgi:hypothetical protein
MSYQTEQQEIANRYVLGATPRLKVTTIDTEGEPFEPTELRLSVKHPTGDIYTWSGADLTMASGYMYYIFRNADTVGWYQYESWVKDGNGLEDTATKGFEIYDSVYAD